MNLPPHISYLNKLTMFAYRSKLWSKHRKDLLVGHSAVQGFLIASVQN